MEAGGSGLGRLLRRFGAAPRRVRPEDVELARRCIAEDPVTGSFRRLGVELSDGAEERLELFARTAHICPRVRLGVAGHEVNARISRTELWRFYLPVCQAVSHLRSAEGPRFLVGIAGPGASGKSVFAALLKKAVDSGMADRGLRAVVCPLDGFHYPNAYLDAHVVCRPGIGKVPLRALKGAPETFDAESFRDALRKLRKGGATSLPLYDRRIHDPVPGGIHVRASENLVLVEGNYLLLEEERWRGVAEELDLALFLRVPFETARRAMIARHVRGGRDRKDAAAHFERVDGPNFRLIMRSAARADLIVERDARQRVVGMAAGPSGRRRSR